MNYIKEYIDEVKSLFISSPIRKCLGDNENIPFRDLISKSLNEVMENVDIIESKENKPLKIVIVGEVKAGKSSLVNALLSRDVSEVDVLEATSSIIEIVYDKDENTKIINGVNKIGLDLEYLKRINIVDTPGLKSISYANEQKTMNYIQNADLIVYVIDATHLGQEDIVETLDLISSYKKPLIGIINKSDLLEDDKEQVMEYIKEEYELYIEDFFMISSYLEYQDRISKKVPVGNTDIVISSYSELKENFLMLSSYIEKVNNNSEHIKYDSIKSSINGVIHKDIINHHDYLKSVTILIEQLKKYERLLENKIDYINSKMDFELNDWINRMFLSDEISKIKDNIENTSMYINENYINDLINKKKIELDNLFFAEWSECLKELSDEIDEDIKKYVEDINYKNELLNTPNFRIDTDKPNLSEMLATVGTGAILGATSGTILSVYAAGVGSSATSLTIGSSLMMYCPPLLIAGTITGAIGKLVYDKVKLDQKNKDVLKDINDFREKLQSDILYSLLEGYKNSSREIASTTTEIFRISKGVSMSKYEIENMLNEIELYIKNLQKHIEN